MSDSNRVALTFLKESTYGVTPVGNGQIMRFSSESLKRTAEYSASPEIVSDGQITDHVLLGIGAAGSINGVLSATTYDTLLASALRSSGFAGSATYTASTISISSNHLLDSANGFGSLVVGQYIRTAGFASASNNKVLKITAKTSSGDITVSGETLVNVSAGPSITITQGSYIENGTTLDSYSIERQNTDIASMFEVFRGMFIGSFSLTLATKRFMEMSLGFQGKDSATFSSEQLGSPTAATVTDVLNTVAHVVASYEGGAAASNKIGLTGFSVNVNNNPRSLTEIGTLGSTGIGLGSFLVTGSLELYFKDFTQYTKFLNDTYSSFAIVVKDSANKGYVIDLPSIKFQDGERVTGGQNQDVVVKLPFGARKDTSLGKTMRIHSIT